MEFDEITKYFGIPNAEEITAVGSGHINATYILKCSDNYYILQQLNRSVFHDPQTVMGNISEIEKIFSALPRECAVAVPHYLTADDGKNYTEHDNEIYRMYKFADVNPSVPDKFYKTGFAFGNFIKILNAGKLNLSPTIENYHSYQSYFYALVTADNNSSFKKIDSTVMRRLADLENMAEQVFTVDFPQRFIHGDAKTDNIIFSEKSVIIDLDTVMKGYAAIDYGDIIRSSCSPEYLDFAVIYDITNGFADGLDSIITDDEIYSLYYGILYVTGELAVRYLTDYLSERKYFRGKTSAECLSRANELLRQLNLFISHGDEITSIIYKTFKK